MGMGYWVGLNNADDQARIQGGGVVTPPALDHQFFFSTNFLTICRWRHTGNVQGGVLVNVQEWGYFSIFLRVDDVTWTMSKGGACECPRVGVFVIFWRADDVTRTMSKGGGGVLVNVLTPPSGNPVSAPDDSM